MKYNLYLQMSVSRNVVLVVLAYQVDCRGSLGETVSTVSQLVLILKLQRVLE